MKKLKQSDYEFVQQLLTRKGQTNVVRWKAREGIEQIHVTDEELMRLRKLAVLLKVPVGALLRN